MTSFFPNLNGCQNPPPTSSTPLVTKRPFSTERSSAGKDLNVQSSCGDAKAIPIPSMSDIFTYIYHKHQANEGTYTIHGYTWIVWDCNQTNETNLLNLSSNHSLGNLTPVLTLGNTNSSILNIVYKTVTSVHQNSMFNSKV